MVRTKTEIQKIVLRVSFPPNRWMQPGCSKNVVLLLVTAQSNVEVSLVETTPGFPNVPCIRIIFFRIQSTPCTRKSLKKKRICPRLWGNHRFVKSGNSAHVGLPTNSVSTAVSWMFTHAHVVYRWFPRLRAVSRTTTRREPINTLRSCRHRLIPRSQLVTSHWLI